MALNSSSLFFSNHLHPVYQHSFSSAKWREQCCKDYLGACPSSSLTEIDEHLKVWKQAPKTLAFKMDWFKSTVVKNQQYSLSTWYFLLKRRVSNLPWNYLWPVTGIALEFCTIFSKISFRKWNIKLSLLQGLEVIWVPQNTRENRYF